MESTPVWWDLHQLGCLLGLKFYRATLLGSDGGYCTGKVCVTLWVVQAVNISFTTATLKCHSNKKSILLPEAKGWQDIVSPQDCYTVMITGDVLHAYLNLAFAIIFLASSSVLPTKESLLIAMSWSPGRSRPS